MTIGGINGTTNYIDYNEEIIAFALKNGQAKFKSHTEFLMISMWKFGKAKFNNLANLFQNH